MNSLIPQYICLGDSSSQSSSLYVTWNCMHGLSLFLSLSLSSLQKVESPTLKQLARMSRDNDSGCSCGSREGHKVLEVAASQGSGKQMCAFIFIFFLGGRRGMDGSPFLKPLLRVSVLSSSGVPNFNRKRHLICHNFGVLLQDGRYPFPQHSLPSTDRHRACYFYGKFTLSIFINFY